MLRIPRAGGRQLPAPRLPEASGGNPAAAFPREGGAEGYLGPIAPPLRRTLRGRLRGGNPGAAPSPTDWSPRRPRSSSHTFESLLPCALPNPKFGLRGHTAGGGEELYTSQRGKHTRLAGREKPAPAYPQNAIKTHLPPLPLAAGKLGAFMAPQEEGLQAERMSPLRYPSLSLYPLTHEHLEPLASGRSPANDPSAHLAAGSRHSKPPLSPNQFPSPSIWSIPIQCGNVRAAQTDRNSLQSEAEADAGSGQ